VGLFHIIFSDSRNLRFLRRRFNYRTPASPVVFKPSTFCKQARSNLIRSDLPSWRKGWDIALSANRRLALLPVVLEISKSKLFLSLRSSSAEPGFSSTRYSSQLRKNGATKSGGRGGIRTHGTVAGTTVFKTVSLNHSDTLPYFVAATGVIISGHPYKSKVIVFGQKLPHLHVLRHGF
jgi:hypothetical protein